LGHDVHFLERLPQRVSPAQMDYALALYRDAELVRLVLEDPRVPADAARVAVALSPAGAGPYVVLERPGRFVTCLADGMRHDLPIIPRERVQAHEHRRDTLEERLAIAKQLAGDAKPVKVVSRADEKAHLLSREEFLAASAWSPVLGLEFLRSSYTAGGIAVDALTAYAHEWNKPRPGTDELMRITWRMTWSSAHHLLLSGLDGVPSEVPKDVRISRLYGWLPFRLGYLGTIARALWTYARAGRELLPQLKHDLDGAHATPAMIDLTSCALAAIALRSGKLATEARRALHRLPGAIGSKARADYARALVALLEKHLADPGPLRGIARAIGADLILKRARHDGPDDRPLPWTSPDEVPEDIALPFLLHEPLLLNSVGGHGGLHGVLFGLVAWLAGVPAEALYLPAEWVDRLCYDYGPLFVVQQATYWHGQRQRAPVRVEPKPERNAPCTCGSGRKYKKCCGA
jgi:hypothetical protein